MSKRTNKRNHHNKQMHIKVNNTWNKALFKLQACFYRRWTPHPTTDSTQRFPFCSFILMNSPEGTVPSSQSLLLCCASQSEAIRAGGAIEGLIHGTTSRMQLWAPHPQCSHQSADISDPTKMHKHYTKAF